MTKKKSKSRGRVGKQKGRSELVAHELGKKEKAKNLAKSGKKSAGLPFNENGLKKVAHHSSGEEKLNRREAFELQRQQAREKALEEKRVRVRAHFDKKMFLIGLNIFKFRNLRYVVTCKRGTYADK